MVAAVDTRASGGAAVSGGRGGVDVAGDDAFAELAAKVRRLERRCLDLEDLCARALATADAAGDAADRALKLRVFTKTERARVDAARNHIVQQVKRFCSDAGRDFNDVFAVCRRRIGLRRVKDGGAAIKRVKRADQVILLARAARDLGVADVDDAAITAILEGA